MLLDRNTRVQKLQEARKILKEEFIGLDSIIDQVVNSVSPWYITPEILTRPTVVSIWGMTGTGKSSVVRRLTELLSIKDDTLFFDCGVCTAERKDIIEEISNTFGHDDEEETRSSKKNMGGNLVFVFDEFQYAKTMNENGEEVINASIRPIWELLDSGIININDRYDWEFARLCEVLEDLEPVVAKFSHFKTADGKFTEREEIEAILDEVGFSCYTERVALRNGEKRKNFGYNGPVPVTEEDKVEDPLASLPIVDPERIRYFLKRANKREPGLGKKMNEDLLNAKTFGEYYKILKGESVIGRGGKILDCTKSLVFVVGNLDEAYQVSKDMSADVDPDIFYDITKRVSVGDIKNALLRRFRPEQVARLGNNLIKYPTFKGEDFRKIIETELEKCRTGFEKTVSGISVRIEDEIKDLIYHEGVFPSQGIRPLFSTIGMFLTPYFSEIVMKKENSSSVSIGVKDYTSGFRCETATIYLKFNDERIIEYPTTLQLGELRDVKNRKKRYAASVQAMVTGYAPSNIVSVSVDRGGFCDTYIKDQEGEIQSKHELECEIMVGLAGYYAEKIIFGEDRPEMILLGSSSDIEEVWEAFSTACYDEGYLFPYSLASRETETNRKFPSGFDSNKKLCTSAEPESVESAETIMWNRFSRFIEATKKILKDEELLLKKMALQLGELGYMTKKTFLHYVRSYGNKLTIESMEKTREKYSPDYYLNKLME
jgi:cell division protease FtsH